MNSEQVRALLRRQPFEPLEVRLSNGDRHVITHPEQVLLTKNTMHIYYPDRDHVAYLSLLHVASIERFEMSS